MNVNDLNRTDNRNTTQRVNISQPGINHQPPTTQSINISTVQEPNQISINATNGNVSGIADADNGNRPVIHVNPNRRKGHRTATQLEQEESTIDPNNYVTPTPKPEPKFFQDKYVSELDAAVARKKQEYVNAVESMIAQDAANRENVENGLETVGDEIQYMPNELYQPMTDDEKVIPDNNTIAPNSNNIAIEDIDEDEYLDDNDSVEEVSHIQFNNNEVITNPNIVTEDIEEEDRYIDDNDATEDFETSKSEVITTNDTVIEDLDSKILHMNSTDLEDIDDSDLIDDEDDEESTSSEDDVDEDTRKVLTEAATNNLRNDIINKIINAGRKVNASQLVVSNKVINIKDVMKSMKSSTVRTATWPLMFANRPYIASSLKGAEISMLNENNDNGLLSIPQARILFEHDVNPYRPSTIEAWAKTIPYADLDNIYAALFMASVEGANYMPCNCTNNSCLNSWLSDDVPMDKLIRFGDDESKKKFEEIKKMELTAENSGAYDSVVTVINDNLAVGIKIPSLYTILYEFGSLDDAFSNKYEAIINIIRFIDRLYFIDENSNMNPIGWKKYPGDHSKTFKSKIITYAKILKELNSVEFSVVSTLIISMLNGMHTDVSYYIPTYTCPKCGHKSAENEVSARNLLFLHQQLVRIATSLTGR